MGKTIIRLTESDLHKIISDSVYRILEENTNINEGWKNWAMAGALGAATMFGNPQTVNAQNPVVDGFTNPNEVVGKKYDRLLLDPSKSIKENYAKIDSLISLHKENNYAEYSIFVEGHYTNKKGDFYNWNIGIITVKGRYGDLDEDFYGTIGSQIINTLTKLYSYSLDEPFHVPPREYHTMTVNEKELDVDVKTGRSYKHQNGDISTEYVKSKGRYGGNTLYCLYSTSPLFKKIYNKVVEETGLKDGGKLYDLERKYVNDAQSDDAIYDLQGRQVEKGENGLPNGAYIVNGKKVTIKDKENKESATPKKKNKKYDDDMYY